MYHFSDSDSVDSDEGIRYKTESIRNKTRSRDSDSPSSKKDSHHSHRERKRSRSPRYRDRNERQKVKKKGHLPEDEINKKDRRISGKSKTRDDDERDTRKHKEKNKRKSQKDSNEYKYREEPTSSGQLVIKANEHCKERNSEKVEKSVPFGPVLPPKKHKSDSSKETKTESENKSIVIGPALPSNVKLTSDENAQNEDSKLINSMLPPHFVTVSSLEDDSSDELVETVGPDLPPDLKEIDSYIEPSLLKNTEQSDAPKQEPIVGPALPPHLLKNHLDKDKSHLCDPELPEKPVDVTIGPDIPTHLRQKLLEGSSDISVATIEEGGINEEDEVYGPIPIGENYSKAHIELEERALKMKMDQLEPAEDKQAGREEWMLTLPAAKAASFGLGPRQFRAKAGPDLSDRSSWTDTPEDKAKKKAGKEEPKVDLQKEAELREIKRRDKEQEAIAKKNKKHKESLVDMHTKKLKKEKKNESESSERRPFSREIDLQVNRFDEAQKKAVLKKAQLLDTRFSAGESKFL